MTIAGIHNPYIGTYFASLKIIGIPELKDIVRVVSDVTKVTEEQMKEKNRKPQIVFARQMCWKLIKEYDVDISLTDIGKAFGGKDHTTVIYGVEAMSNRIDREDDTRMTYEQIKKQLRISAHII